MPHRHDNIWCWCKYKEYCKYYGYDYKDWNVYMLFCQYFRLNPYVYMDYWTEGRWVGGNSRFG